MTRSDVLKFRTSSWRFAIALSGGGSAFVSDYLATPGASASFLEAIVPYATEATDDFLGFRPESYCCEKTARLLASAALKRATFLEQRAVASGKSESDPLALAGVGVTCSLASDRPKKGDHRAFCAIQTRRATFSATLTLHKGARSREEEERFVADFILSTALAAVEISSTLNWDASDENWREFKRELSLATSCVRFELDEATISWAALDRVGAALLFGHDSPTIEAFAPNVGALRFMRGRPDRKRTFDDKEYDLTTGRELDVASKTLYPGSFNPPHDGHVTIARLASERSGVSTELEISARNVDKPSLDALELVRRLDALTRLMSDTPVWISNVPRYVEKATLFPNAYFAMGTDTILRLADPKYEGDSLERRDAVVARLRDLNARFCVFTRKIKGTLLSQEQVEERLPNALCALCQFVPPEIFLDDVSSTELRRRK